MELLVLLAVLAVPFLIFADAVNKSSSKQNYSEPKSTFQLPRFNLNSGTFATLVISILVIAAIGAGIFLGRLLMGKPKTYVRPPVQTIQTETQDEKQSQAATESSGFSGWHTWSNGTDWKFAPESNKRDLCSRLASNSRKGNSAAFFYDALQEMFNTTDSQILAIKLDDACSLIESASSTLPQRMRNY